MELCIYKENKSLCPFIMFPIEGCNCENCPFLEEGMPVK